MKINIAGFIYDVIETTDDISPTEQENPNLIGLVDYASLKIYVRKDSAPQMRVSTIWHEAVHAWLEQSGVINQDESFVETMGFCIASLIANNPELVARTSYMMNTDRTLVEDKEYQEENQVVGETLDDDSGLSKYIGVEKIQFPNHTETNEYEYDTFGRVTTSVKTISYDNPTK